MHKLATWGISAVVITAMSGLVSAAEPARSRDPGVVAFQRWHAGTPPVAPAKPAKAKSNPVADAEKADSADALKAQEKANLMRRLSVCDKLRMVALESGDEKLEQQVDNLEQKASQVYQQRTVKPAVKTDKGEKP